MVFPQPSGPQPDDGPGPICSARGCRAVGLWALRWNNPRLHTPDRRKTWLACDDHRTSLSDFLSMRGFLREVVGVEVPGVEVPGDDAPGDDAPGDDVPGDRS